MSNAICGINEYADSRGIARGTFKGIIKDEPTRLRNGIQHGFDGKEKKVYAEIMDREWFNRYRVEQEAKGKVFVPKLPKALAREMSDVPYDEQQLVIPANARQQVETGGEVVNDEANGYWFAPGVRADLLEANRIWTINKARKEKMLADEMAGVLIRKDEVEKQLMTCGLEIRKMLELLPARCIDKVLAAKGRHEALLELQDGMRNGLEEVLNTLTELFNKQGNEQSGQ